MYLSLCVYSELCVQSLFFDCHCYYCRCWCCCLPIAATSWRRRQNHPLSRLWKWKSGVCYRLDILPDEFYVQQRPSGFSLVIQFSVSVLCLSVYLSLIHFSYSSSSSNIYSKSVYSYAWLLPWLGLHRFHNARHIPKMGCIGAKCKCFVLCAVCIPFAPNVCVLLLWPFFLLERFDSAFRILYYGCGMVGMWYDCQEHAEQIFKCVNNLAKPSKPPTHVAEFRLVLS